MFISIVLAHPDPNSFNHAIARTALQTCHDLGHDAVLHDLHADGFDPLLPAREIPSSGQVDPLIVRHCEEAADADGFIMVHPNWWGMPPAIMTGWVDRVLRPEVAYRFVGGDKDGEGGEGVPQGLLKARTAMVFNTSNTNPEREMNSFGDPLERIWKDCIFDLCGVRNFYRRMFRIICISGKAQRKAWLDEAARAVAEYFPGA